MLKRIKVRAKLLVLVITPLIALAAFAATGVSERLESSDFFTREERIADLADAGADLTVAVHVERNRALQIGAGGEADIEGAVAATDVAVDRWLVAASAAKAELTGTVVDEIDSFAALLSSARASRAGSDMTVVADQLLQVGRSINTITIGLTTQAEDLSLYRALSDYLQLSRVQFGIAEITTIGAESIATDGIATGDFALLRTADAAVDGGIDQFRNFADAVYVSQLQGLIDDGALSDVEATDTIVELQFFVNRPDRSAATLEWLQLGEDRLIAVHDVSSALLGSASESAALAATTAGEEAQSFLILAGVVIIGAIVLALFVGRSISRPLRRLTANAERLSSEELPALVESMRQGSSAPANTLTPIDTRGRDEIAQLATAISDIQEVTVAVAEEQGDLLRRGISDMFVNLARRNQTLLDRQIEFIDQLEAQEENPDTLENLFLLDHLATRMRRNAESLLVLAGAESSRRRGHAVEIVDVVRVAMGEMEDFSRIRMLSIAPATVAGSVAVDLAHLLSELMENASQFSPPEAPVEIVGQQTEDGTYQLTVTDQGIGLSPEQLIDANHLLTNPPVVGLELGRSLGFTVVSRLAHRLGISARLASSAQGGVTAVVSIPSEMTGELSSTEPVAETPDALAASGLAAASSEPIGLPDGTTAGQGFDLGVGGPPAAAADSAAPVFGGDPLFDLGVSPSGPGVAEADNGTSEESDSELAAADDGDSADMFDILGAAAPRPDPRSSAGADIFASLDSTTAEPRSSGLPKRTPRTESAEPAPPENGPPLPPAPQEVGPPLGPAPQEVGPPPGPAPQEVGPPPGPAPQEIGPPLEPTPGGNDPLQQSTPPENHPPRQPTPAASVGAVDASVTSAGLIRRTPKGPGQSEVADGDATSNAARSPEEVRQMLSRYRTGLRRGRETPTSRGST